MFGSWLCQVVYKPRKEFLPGDSGDANDICCLAFPTMLGGLQLQLLCSWSPSQFAGWFTTLVLLLRETREEFCFVSVISVMFLFVSVNGAMSLPALLGPFYKQNTALGTSNKTIKIIAWQPEPHPKSN